ncbi:MAG: FtsH protease activity modulator HflK [bacterium]
MAKFKKTINIGGETVEIPRGFNSKNILFFIIGIIVLILIFSSFYTVAADEEAVIRQFGKYVRTTQSGLHMKLPFGIETVRKVRVKHVFTSEFGFRTLKAGQRTRYAPQKYTDESLMLTGDLNLAVVEWIVQYQIQDPREYLFNLRDVEETIRAISEARMRKIVGDYSVTEVLTTNRREVALKTQEILQEVLDKYNCGILITMVKLQDVNPPDKVKPAFNEVNEAKQEKERMINQAWQSYNDAIPNAKGEAKKTIQKAEGYALNRINRARGDSVNFVAVWNAYRYAKNVTKDRMYLETMTEILPKVKEKFIFDETQEGVLQFLPLRKGGEK